MLENIIIVTDYGYVEGGAGNVAHQTAIALKKKGYNVSFFCAVGPVSDNLIKENIEVICLNQKDLISSKNKLKMANQGIYNRYAYKKLCAYLSNFDNTKTIVHVHTWTKSLSSSIFRATEKLNFKVLLTVHDYFLPCPNGALFIYKYSQLCKYKPMSLKCILCNCDSRNYLHKIFRIFRQIKQNSIIKKSKNINYAFISEFSKNILLNKFKSFPKDKLFDLPNPITFATNRYRVVCENNDEYLFIGSLTKIKGIEIFCQAVTVSNVKATVIGVGPLLDELTIKYPNISFVGWKNKQEMQAYLNKSRCLVFSSICYETMGLTPLEVMSYGLPVLCSNINAASAYVPKDLHYDGTNLHSLIDKIKWIEKTNVKEISEKIFNEFDAVSWSEDKHVENLAKIYNAILDKNS